MAYYVAVLLLCACLFYAMLLCFLFVEKAAEYVESYWALISDITHNEGLAIHEVDLSSSSFFQHIKTKNSS